MCAQRQMTMFPQAACRGMEPVLISTCLLGVPCRWHGCRAKRRDSLIERLNKRHVFVRICPEQLGGMPTQRTSETLDGANAAQLLDEGRRLIAPETGEDVTRHYVNGARCTSEIAKIVSVRRAYLKSGSPSCDKQGVTGEMLRRAGIAVMRVA